MILALIVACEIGFWVAILAGLATRYLARRPRLGAAMLIAAPVIDAVLLALVTIDLMRGGTASWHHGLAAIYIGISIAYGHRMIAWADRYFAYRFDGAPRPARLTGEAYTRLCWGDVGRTGLAMGIAAGILFGLTLLVGDPERTAELETNYRWLAIIFGVDLLWAISYTIWPAKDEAERATTESG